MAIYRGNGETGTGGVSDIAELAQEAAASAEAAEAAQLAAETAETNAELAETNAETAATNAANSASAASTSASNAASSATAASNSASTATTQATNAANSATAAATSASNAATSATNAANSATSASTSASTATTQATNAANSATAAASSASSASTSATNAASSASTATTQATNAANSATAAATSATNASNSASAAATSATNAANSATSASTSATSAAASAAAAAATVTSKVSKSGDVMTGSLEVPTEASLKATALTRPNIRPSLLLDFANTKQLDPRVTFSRASTGAYYDGKTVAKAEENLLLRSQEFNESPWVPSRASITSNSTTAPDGTLTADSLIEDTSASISHRILYGVVSMIVVGQPYVISVFAKKNTRDQIFIRSVGSNSDSNGCLFDLTLGTVTNIGSGAVGSIVAGVNGWYRCIVNVASASAQTDSCYIGLAVGGNTFYTGDGTSGLYIWGAQLEQRSTATAYTPTTTAPITNYIPALQTAAANVARFDHDPVTGESKGLLIEEQRTNLLTYSEQFDNAAWVKTSSSILANQVISPDGTLSGDKLIDNTTNGQHWFRQDRTIVANTAHTISVYMKAAERTLVRFGLLNNTLLSGAYAQFNLTTGVISGQTIAGTATNASYSIISVGNGWYRCSVTATVDSSSTTATPYFGVLDASGNVTYTGDGYSGLYIWGAQLEAGAFPTSYIPTVASQVTRSADSASMTGSNFSSWYRQDEGTIYVDFSISNKKRYDIAFLGTNNNGTPILFSTNGVDVLGGIFGATNVTASNINGLGKAAFGYKVNDLALSVNGASTVTGNINFTPALNTTFYIGNRDGSFYPANGTIKRIAYYPKRLSNTELQGLTS